MDKRLSNFGFRLISLEFKLRDFLRPRKGILKKVGIKQGLRYSITAVVPAVT